MSFVGDPGELDDPNAQMALAETTMATPDVDTDTAAIAQRVFDVLADALDGWSARNGNLEVWLIETFSAVAAEIRSEAVTVPEAIYQTFGEEVLGIVARAPAPATGMSTWLAPDTRGYTIPAGTQFTLARTGDDLVAFQVVATAEIPIGETSIDNVAFVAITNGIAGNDLSTATSTAELIDPLFWNPVIEVPLLTAGGDDGQTVDDYLTELILLLRLIALRPILPLDFAILALRIAGVGRAVAMDGFDPSDNTWGNARMVTLILTDPDGEKCSIETKQAVQTYLESLREVNYIVNVIDASYETVNITYEVTTFAGMDGPTVKDQCDQALTDALQPSLFRLGTATPAIAGGELIPPPATGQTPGRQTLRVNDFIALLDRQRGVDWVGPVKINGGGDHVMGGPYTLPEPGTMTGTVTVPASAINTVR